jgi:hypothetical protein
MPSTRCFAGRRHDFRQPLASRVGRDPTRAARARVRCPARRAAAARRDTRAGRGARAGRAARCTAAGIHRSPQRA